MAWKGYLLLLSIVLPSLIVMVVMDTASSQIDEPIRIEGEYLRRTTEGTYRDDLQPGDSTRYTVVVENNELFDQVRRLTITNVPPQWHVFFDNGGSTVLANVPSLTQLREGLNVKTPVPGEGNIVVNVSMEDGSSWKAMLLRLVCQEGPLRIDVPSASYILGREDPVLIRFTIENIGPLPLNVSLSMDGIANADNANTDIWSVELTERQLVLGPNSSREMGALVRCPQDEPINSQRITRIVTKVENITRPFQSDTLTLKVETIYDLRASVTPIGYQKVEQGGQVTATISVENWASATDHVIIRKDTVPGGWTLLFDDVLDPTQMRFSVLPGEKRLLHPVIYVPMNTQAGMKDIVLIAEGDKNETPMVIKVEVSRSESMQMRTLAQGGIYPVTLGPNELVVRGVNLGNFYDRMNVTVISAPDWMTAKFTGIVVGNGDRLGDSAGSVINLSKMYNDRIGFPPSTSVSLGFGPFQTADLLISADIPVDARVTGDDKIRLRYTHGSAETIGELDVTFKLVLVDLEIVDIDGDFQPDLDIWPKRSDSRYEVGDTIYFQFTVRNNYPYPPDGIGYSIELFGYQVASGDLGPIPSGSAREYNVSWKMDKSTDGEYSFRLKLTGDPYDKIGESPGAKTEEEVRIEGGRIVRNWPLIIGFVLVMVALIAGFLFLVNMAQRSRSEREEKDKARYEKVYGRSADASPKARSGRLDDDQEKRRRPQVHPSDRTPPDAGIDGRRRGKASRPRDQERASISGPARARPVPDRRVPDRHAEPHSRNRSKVSTADERTPRERDRGHLDAPDRRGARRGRGPKRVFEELEEFEEI